MAIFNKKILFGMHTHVLSCSREQFRTCSSGLTDNQVKCLSSTNGGKNVGTGWYESIQPSLDLSKDENDGELASVA